MMHWLSIFQTASALTALGILTTGSLILKHYLKKRIRRKETVYV